ncbi:MAG: DnaA N-terminal domain-containing protein, partial [Pseudomonadota bacterium]
MIAAQNVPPASPNAANPNAANPNAVANSADPQAAQSTSASQSDGGEINPILHRLYHQWQAVQERMRGEIGDNAHKNWLTPLVPTGQVGGEVMLAAPTRFMKDWVNRHYVDRLRQLWAAEDGSVRRVELIISPNAAANLAKAISAAPPPPPEALKPSAPANQERPYKMHASLAQASDE